jgi:hypothetical protein
MKHGARLLYFGNLLLGCTGSGDATFLRRSTTPHSSRASVLRTNLVAERRDANPRFCLNRHEFRILSSEFSRT